MALLALGAGAFAGAELGLRLAPAVIPAALLDHFPYDLQQQIEVGQTLFRRHSFVDVPRDDGGPALYVPAPETVFWQPQHASDRAFGAVEAVATDDTGFCNPSTRQRSAEDAEIVALGDSFTWCVSVAPEDAWPAQLEALTRRPTYNLGRGGIGLFEELQILKTYGLPRNPKMVILNVYGGNDLDDAFRYWRARRQTEPDAGYPPLPTVERVRDIWLTPAADPWWRRLARETVRTATWATPLGHSYVVSLGLAVYQAGVGSRPAADHDFRYDVQVNGRVVEFNTGNGTLGLISARAVAEGHLSPSLLDPGLASFAEMAEESGFRAVVTYTPSAPTAYEGLANFRADGIADVIRHASRMQREWLRDAARRHGLEYLDLTPFLQRAAAVNPEPLYFPRNQHLTAVGHRVVAAALAAALRQPAPTKGLPAGAISSGRRT